MNDGFNYQKSIFAMAGSFFLFTALVSLSITQVYIPQASLQYQARTREELLSENEASMIVYIPSKLLCSAILSASLAVISHSTLDNMMNLMFGSAKTYRSHSMASVLLSGCVIVNGLSPVAEPLFCMLIGVVCGIVYTVGARFLTKNSKVIQSDYIVIYGVMTVLQVLMQSMFSIDGGFSTGNNNQAKVSVQLFGLFVIITWAVLWSWGIFYLLKKAKRLKVGEIYDVIGQDTFSLGS
jgi:ammonia channel protein AmtB